MNDIWYNILKEAQINNSYYINKGVNALYKQDILNNQCLKSISKKEIDQYTKLYRPHQYCQFVVTLLEDDANYSYYNGLIVKRSGTHGYNYYYNDCVIMEYVKRHEEYDTVEEAIFDESRFRDVWQKDNYNNTIIDTLPEDTFSVAYDLVTSYYVLKNRTAFALKHQLACSQDFFAKKTVIDTLDYLYENTPLEKLLLYLWCNARIMGLNILNTPDSFDIPDDEEKAKIYVDQWYIQIRKYLHILDDSIYQNDQKYILEDAKKYSQTYIISDEITL